MSQLIIAGDTSGTVTLQAPAVAGSTTLTLPSVSGNIITNNSGVSPSTAGNVLTSDGTNWVSASKLTLMASQPSTSGTTVTFSSIPSWAKRITVTLSGVTYTGGMTIQLGTSSGLVITGYTGGSGVTTNGNTTSVGAKSNGFSVEGTNSNATGIWHIVNISGNNWTASWTWSNHGSQFGGGGGYIALTGTLTQLAAVAGTAFSAGNIGVIYE